MKWGMAGKGSIPHVAAEARRVAALLEARGEEVLWEDAMADAAAGDTMPLDRLDKEVDLFVTVGGDGTILHAQAATQKPIFGINAGAIGFLAEVEPPQAEAGIDAILAGKHRIDERHKLSVRLGDVALSDATNEVTLQTSRIAKLIRFRVDVDGETLDTVRGDGIIVSTPTGSTGYAMSVGGPLVHPGVSATVLAPIAPFKLSARPWVVPASSVVELTLMDRDSAQGVQQARVVVDGQHGLDMDTGATLTVRQSDRKARYVRLGGGFYERVRTKLIR